MMKYRVRITYEQEVDTFVETDNIEETLDKLQDNFNWNHFERYGDGVLEIDAFPCVGSEAISEEDWQEDINDFMT